MQKIMQYSKNLENGDLVTISGDKYIKWFDGRKPIGVFENGKIVRYGIAEMKATSYIKWLESRI